MRTLTIGNRLLVVVALLLTPAGVHAAKLTCLSGTDPSVVNDLTKIIAARDFVDAACTCGNYDGSPGKTHRDYLTCAKGIIAKQVSAGKLRKQCKGTVTTYYSTSSCGVLASNGDEPCITTSKSGKVSCAIKPQGKCKGTPCPGFSTCEDAADTNHDGLIGAGDSGSCVVGCCTCTATVQPNGFNDVGCERPDQGTLGCPFGVACPHDQQSCVAYCNSFWNSNVTFACGALHATDCTVSGEWSSTGSCVVGSQGGDFGSCGPYCGDGVCNGAETEATCCTDCGCTQSCESQCQPPQGVANCKCYPANGNHQCVAECTVATCGDGVCSPGEQCNTCPADCGCSGSLPFCLNSVGALCNDPSSPDCSCACIAATFPCNPSTPLCCPGYKCAPASFEGTTYTCQPG